MLTRSVEGLYDVKGARLLGLGSQAVVRGCSRRTTGCVCALKIVLKAKAKDSALQSLHDEAQLLGRLDHPGIIRAYAILDSDAALALVLQHCKGGTLLSRMLDQPRKRFAEVIARKYMQQLVSAVRYCHEKSIVHRDLKMENVLCAESSCESEVKIIDFGLSCYCSTGEYLRTAVGSVDCIAPEALSGAYNAACDMWSLGVVAYRLMSGKAPFVGADMVSTMRLVKQGAFSFDDSAFEDVSDDAKDFIRRLLEKDLATRMTASEAQQHPWCRVHTSSDAVEQHVVLQLKAFVRAPALQKLAQLAVAFKSPSSSIRAQRCAFELMDNGTGTIQLDSFSHTLARSGVCEEEATRMFAALTWCNAEPSIRWSRFLAATVDTATLDDILIAEAFDLLSGFESQVSKVQLKDFAGTALTDAEVEHMLRERGLQLVDTISLAQVMHPHVVNAERANVFAKFTQVLRPVERL
jgi:calcium-dependent protein kinase